MRDRAGSNGSAVSELASCCVEQLFLLFRFIAFGRTSGAATDTEMARRKTNENGLYYV